ncbi:MAG TPA: DNA polymerase/3'-5' exonuclease PolX [Gemmataceae bacterium]|nr:DNA polymerase/3'-5' exonuclease PolX [Gemmataceae bacterium]
MTKEDVAAALQEIGILLELKGEPSFRTMSYHSASRALLDYQGDFPALVASGKVTEIHGIGDVMRAKIETLIQTGEIPQLTTLRAEIPPGIIQMLRVPGLGPKKVKALYDQLKIDSLDGLRAACLDGRVAKIKGFGGKTQEKILDGLRFLSEVGHRVRIDEGYSVGVALGDRLSRSPGVTRAALAGSLRRRKEVAGNVNLLAAAEYPKGAIDAFVSQPEVMQVVGRTDSTAAVVVGMAVEGHRVVVPADLRIVPDDAFSFALMHLTGSKEHNARLRKRAADRGMALTETGLTADGQAIPCSSEADIYATLELSFIPPELRENTGEIEGAERDELPKLIEPKDIRGVFHNHTTYSDGTATLEEMALASKALGFEYFGVGDHSQSLRVARGLSIQAIQNQHRDVDALNQRLSGIRILRGIECDILEDGSLDYPDDVLKWFDYVVVSVHTLFGMPAEKMTARVCKALSHPATTILGHATGRLLLRREGYKVDMEEVLRVAAENGKMIEINAQPTRLDIDWMAVRQAKAMGIPIVINPDAHSTGELALYEYGVDVARRGWLEKDDVFNTQPLREVIRDFERRKAGG